MATIPPRRDELALGEGGVLSLRYVRFLEDLNDSVTAIEEVEETDPTLPALGGLIAGQLGILFAELSASQGQSKDFSHLIASLIAQSDFQQSELKRLNDEIEDLRNIIPWQ